MGGNAALSRLKRVPDIFENIVLVKIAKPKELYCTPLKFVRGAILLILTTTIKVNIGRCLLGKVVYRIRLRIEINEDMVTIAAAVKVVKKTIYKMRLNFNIWGEPYALPTVVLGRLRALLLY